jgi:hypothetical protein
VSAEGRFHTIGLVTGESLNWLEHFLDVQNFRVIKTDEFERI